MNGEFARGATTVYFSPGVESQDGIEWEWINGKLDAAIEEIEARYERKRK